MSDLIGYDDAPIAIGDRIELNPGCDLWMRGARYGQLVGTNQTPDDRCVVVLDRIPGRKFSASADTVRKVTS